VKLLTVFTPTFNRSSLLSRCYNSLLKQTSNDFIWQLIDDGSTDGTEDTVNNFIREGIIDIVYIKKENGGKVSAINRSMEVTQTELWMCLDSDDYLFDHAVEIIKSHYSEIFDNPSVCGMLALRSDKYGKPMQKKSLPSSISYSTQQNVRYNMKIPPEYAQIYKVDIIKHYSYPLAAGEKYMPLSYVPDLLDQKYQLLLIHEPIMICEYQNDGITKNKKKLVISNPESYKIFRLQQIKYSTSWTNCIKACISYDTACIISRDYNIIQKSPRRILTVLCFPFGLLDYIVRYRKIARDMKLQR